MQRTKLERLGDVGSALVSPTAIGPATKWALRIAFLALAGGGIAIAISSQVSEVSADEWQLRPAWLLAAIPLFLAFQMSHMELWAVMMRWLGAPLPTRARAWAIWNVSLLGRYVPTSALVIVARTAMAEREGANARITVVSIAYELALTVAGAVAIGAYFATQLPALEPHGWRYAAFILPVAVIALMHPRVFTPATGYVLRKLGRDPLPATLALPQVLFFTFAYAVGFVVAGFGVYCISQAIHPIEAADTPMVVASYCVGYATAMLGFFLPGGLGAREAGIAVCLSTVLPSSQAIVISVTVRLLQIAIEVGYAAVTPVWARRVSARPASRPA